MCINTGFQNITQLFFKVTILGTSLVIQWLRICLPMQGTQVQSNQEDPTCLGATKSVCHTTKTTL